MVRIIGQAQIWYTFRCNRQVFIIEGIIYDSAVGEDVSVFDKIRSNRESYKIWSGTPVATRIKNNLLHLFKIQSRYVDSVRSPPKYTGPERSCCSFVLKCECK